MFFVSNPTPPPPEGFTSLTETDISTSRPITNTQLPSRDSVQRIFPVSSETKQKVRDGLTLVLCVLLSSGYAQAGSTKQGLRKPASSTWADTGSCHEAKKCCSEESVAMFLEPLLSGLHLQRKCFRCTYSQCPREPQQTRGGNDFDPSEEAGKLLSLSLLGAGSSAGQLQTAHFWDGS